MKLFCSVTCLLLSSILLVTACKQEAQPQAPLITNGDIEQDFKGWFVGYDFQHPTNPNGYASGVTAAAASSPQHSLIINCNQAKNNSAFCYYGQDKINTSAISIGAKLTLNVKIKTNLKGQGVSLVIRGDKENKQVLFASTAGKTLITGTQEFTEYSVVVDSYPGNIDNLLIFLVYLPNTTGYVYFDDVSLVVN